jgi:rhodanese-related sulfurtransferase
MRHYVFIVLLFSAIVGSCASGAQGLNIDAATFEKGIAQPQIQLLDVRTPAEYKEGHLRNAILANWNEREEFKKQISLLDKNKPVYAYCRSGARSSAAAAQLKKEGFKEVYNLEGGIIAWKGANKPVE